MEAMVAEGIEPEWFRRLVGEAIVEADKETKTALGAVLRSFSAAHEARTILADLVDLRLAGNAVHRAHR